MSLQDDLEHIGRWGRNMDREDRLNQIAEDEQRVLWEKDQRIFESEQANAALQQQLQEAVSVIEALIAVATHRGVAVGARYKARMAGTAWLLKNQEATHASPASESQAETL